MHRKLKPPKGGQMQIKEVVNEKVTYRVLFPEGHQHKNNKNNAHEAAHGDPSEKHIEDDRLTYGTTEDGRIHVVWEIDMPKVETWFVEHAPAELTLSTVDSSNEANDPNQESQPLILQDDSPPDQPPTPQGRVQTSLTESVKPGDTLLQVQDASGFQVGDQIIIDEGLPQEEVGEVAGFGSIILQSPLQNDHAAGAVVSVVTQASEETRINVRDDLDPGLGVQDTPLGSDLTLANSDFSEAIADEDVKDPPKLFVEEGTRMEYFSSTHKKWVVGVVKPVYSSREGTVEYHVRMGSSGKKLGVGLDTLRRPFENRDLVEVYSVRDGWILGVINGPQIAHATLHGYQVRVTQNDKESIYDGISPSRLRSRFPPGLTVSAFFQDRGWIECVVHDSAPADGMGAVSLTIVGEQFAGHVTKAGMIADTANLFAGTETNRVNKFDHDAIAAKSDLDKERAKLVKDEDIEQLPWVKVPLKLDISSEVAAEAPFGFAVGEEVSMVGKTNANVPYKALLTVQGFTSSAVRVRFSDEPSGALKDIAPAELVKVLPSFLLRPHNDWRDRDPSRTCIGV
jgi:hypothetical protein